MKRALAVLLFISSGINLPKKLSNCAMLADHAQLILVLLTFIFLTQSFSLIIQSYSNGLPLPFLTFLHALLSYVARLMIDTTQMKSLKQIQF